MLDFFKFIYQIMKSCLALIMALVALDAAFALRPLSMYARQAMFGNNHQFRKSAHRNVKKYSYETLMFEQRIDNFGFGSDDTYHEKVLYNDTHFEVGGPILLYAGNEGEIELFVENSGFLWDLAPQLKGTVIFAEHRYYGESMPYRDESYKSRQKLAYFTADQAMADYAMLIRHIKTTWPGYENSKVIVFGGSYGGMLASWMRMKYPDVFDGAIASSAPIWSFTWPCDSYARVVTQDFVKYGSDNCRNNIRESWNVINEWFKTEENQQKLAATFGLCNETVTNVAALKSYIENAFATVAMVNYPYPTDFLAPLPGWPIEKMCNFLNEDLTQNGEKLLMGINSAVNIYYNSSGQAGQCVEIGTPGSESDGLGVHGWDFQTCTEMTIPFCNTGINDMFEPAPWSDDEWAEHCETDWFGVKPNLNWTEVSYWGKNIESASNILFSNGLLDPWSAGGVMKNLAPTLPIVIIPDGAHHVELRAEVPDDTPACKAAREVEKQWILRWINEGKTVRVEPAHA